MYDEVKESSPKHVWVIIPAAPQGSVNKKHI